MKIRYIPVITCFLSVGILCSMPTSFALYKDFASRVTLSFSGEEVIPETNYFLIGNFNGWADNNNFKLANVTSEMTPETNKIAEYKISNISLSKGSELKLHDSDGNYYDVFKDCWNNSQSDGGNYSTKMTSNSYTFYLKLYSNGTHQIYITCNKDVIFFTPSNNWKNDSATFKLALNNSDNNKINPTSVSNGTYRFDIGNNTKIKFFRMSSDGSSPWNYSNWQTVSNNDTNNTFQLWDTYYGNGQGVWSNWDAKGGSDYGSSCGSWSSN